MSYKQTNKKEKEHDYCKINLSKEKKRKEKKRKIREKNEENVPKRD
jgi:hypothetical protein